MLCGLKPWTLALLSPALCPCVQTQFDSDRLNRCISQSYTRTDILAWPQARKALTKHKGELEVERAHVDKLQRKFSAIHQTLVAAAVPPAGVASPPPLQQQHSQRAA